MSASPAPLLGLCPIGKFVFSHEDAIRQKTVLQARLKRWNIRFVDLDAVIPDGIIRSDEHVAPAIRFFREKNIDALMLPHCNFGTESAVGMLARQAGVPVLLWGPRDEAPLADGTRLRDSLCGMFASSKVMHKLGVPFSYIENCRIDDPPLRQGLDRFLRASSVAGLFRNGFRIGHIGQRIDFFWTTIINESELLERFNIEILPIDLVDFIRYAMDRTKKGRGEYLKEAAWWRAEGEITGFDDDEPLIRIFAVRDQMLAMVQDHGLEAIAMQDFTSIVDAMGTYCFFANSLVSDHCPVSLESDLHGAVSLAMLKRALPGDESVFLADITARHPEDDNGVLLWHAGAPLSMKHPRAKVQLGHHWILPSPLAGMTHFPLREGPLTVIRFDGDRGEYRLAIGEGHSCDGPETQNNYVWMRVNDWLQWERTLMEGPFIHHAAMGYAQVGDALADACRFIPGSLLPVRLP